jgi:hypothetical protein
MTKEVGQGSGSSERMGGYDQFSSLQFYILHIIYVVCIFVLSYYNILYLSVLILQSSCLYYYLFISSCFAIIHEPCLYAYFIYMIYMFHMLCVLMIHIVMDIFEIMLSMFDYLLPVIIIMLIYGIKMVRKMPIFLTTHADTIVSIVDREQSPIEVANSQVMQVMRNINLVLSSTSLNQDA